MFIVCTFSIAWCDVGGCEDVERALRGPSTSRNIDMIIDVSFFSVAWCDIGGYEDVKRALREMIEVPLTRPQLLAKFGAAPARGALLYGPPGKRISEGLRASKQRTLKVQKLTC